MKRLLVAAVLTLLAAGIMLTPGMLASAQDAPSISPAQLQKILKFVDTIGAKEEFPAPTALSLGVSDDPSKVLPVVVVVVVVTDDHKVYFCRSEFDPADYLIWSRTADKDSSYLFRTRSDFKWIRAKRQYASDLAQRPCDKGGRTGVVAMRSIEPGKWYFFVTCKNCRVQIAFANAPPPEEVQGDVQINDVPIQVHCGKCGADTVCRPEEFSIRQAARVR